MLIVERIDRFRDFTSDLRNAGFSEVQLIMPDIFKSRRLMDKFFKSTASDPLPETTTTDMGAFMFIARK